MQSDKPVIGFRNRHEGTAFVTASLVPGERGLCWHPGIFKGTWDHPLLGQFSLEERNITGYLDAFARGVPGPAGIPIDEIGDHTLDPTGAFGCVKSLERDGDIIQTGIKWSAKGQKAIEDELFFYTSMSFSVDRATEDSHWEPNAIISGAMTTRPLWPQQGVLQYHAATLLSREALHQMRDQRAQHFGIEVRPDGRLTAAAQYRDEAPRPVDYADPVNFKYPLMPEIRRLQSLAYFAQSFPHYKEERSRRVVYTRIVRSLRMAGHKPPPNPTLDELLPPDLRVWVAQA